MVNLREFERPVYCVFIQFYLRIDTGDQRPLCQKSSISITKSAISIYYTSNERVISSLSTGALDYKNKHQSTK